MRQRCEYCDSWIDETDEVCPHCGARFEETREDDTELEEEMLEEEEWDEEEGL